MNFTAIEPNKLGCRSSCVTVLYQQFWIIDQFNLNVINSINVSSSYLPSLNHDKRKIDINQAACPYFGCESYLLLIGNLELQLTLIIHLKIPGARMHL